ncbi:MAG: NAD-dependent epimerase/dehydratase family protein [Lachnospiraceae bacterium]|nr:NAD-dependent epimerase/dehydratase family protein [Lachnospiraceae bacterium]
MSLYSSKTYIEDLKKAAGSIAASGGISDCSILITGSTGTVGSFLVDMLLQMNRDQNAGIKVYAASRSYKGFAERFGEVAGDDLVFAQHDNNAPFAFDMDVDYIIHAAGNAHPDTFNNDPVGTVTGNIMGTDTLLKYAASHKVKRFLYISSGEVYGLGDLSLESFDESYAGYLDPMSPRSCYPLSKRAAENLCASYGKQYGIDTVVCRLCHTYGPGMKAGDSRANAAFLRNVINGEDIVMKSAGSQLRSYNYIADCASAILTVLLAGKAGEAYNIANPASRITIAELAQLIASAAGKKVIFSEPDSADIAKQSPIPKQVLDTKKLEALGWMGAFGPAEGVGHTIKILRGE